MEFGRDNCFRYLVCASKSALYAWDVISQGLVWKVGQLHSSVRCLVPDPKSCYMAAVLQNSEGAKGFVNNNSALTYHNV